MFVTTVDEYDGVFLGCELRSGEEGERVQFAGSSKYMTDTD